MSHPAHEMPPCAHASTTPPSRPSRNRLQWEERGGAALTRTMQAWYDEVKDKPYSLSIAKVVGTSDLKQQSAELKHESFFCSELVAYAYQRLGVLSQWFTPS